MKIQLIQGEFSANDALELIAQMIQIKIKYHENKISSQSTEEDIKTREVKIKRLQEELFELRQHVKSNNNVKVEAIINFD